MTSLKDIFDMTDLKQTLLARFHQFGAQRNLQKARLFLKFLQKCYQFTKRPSFFEVYAMRRVGKIGHKSL